MGIYDGNISNEIATISWDPWEIVCKIYPSLSEMSSHVLSSLSLFGIPHVQPPQRKKRIKLVIYIYIPLLSLGPYHIISYHINIPIYIHICR